jgi:hypothetical protein
MCCLEEISDEFGFNPKSDKTKIMHMLYKIRDEISQPCGLPFFGQTVEL